MGVRGALTALLLFLHVSVAPVAADEAELRHVEGTLFRMTALGEVTRTRLGTFRLDSEGPGDLRESPGTAEISLFSEGMLRTSDGVVSEARAVDLRTGRPVTSLGTGICDPGGLFGPPDTSGCLLPGSEGPQSRQLFDDLCRATVGVFTVLTEALADRCLLDLLNENSVELISAFLNPGDPLIVTDPLSQLTFSGFFANLFVGNNAARNVAGLVTGDPNLFLPLNVDPCDGFLDDCATPGPPANSAFGAGGPTLNGSLTLQQQALLGCGPFYGTNCEVDGIALFDTEAAVSVQSFPQVGLDLQTATRVDPATGQEVVLPGARGPTDSDYDPLVDGCVAPSGTFPGDEACGPGTSLLVNPLTGELFPNELAALSYNYMLLLASLSLPDPDCDPDPTSPDCDPHQGDPGCELTTTEGLLACSSLRNTLASVARELEDDPSGPPRLRWVWETGAEFLETEQASGTLASFETWTFHAVGPEVSRRGVEGEAGVLFLLFPTGPVVRAHDPRSAVGPPGLSFTGFYGVVPEPSGELLPLVALLTTAGAARRARRPVRERR